MVSYCFWCGRKIESRARIVSKGKIGLTARGPAIVHPSCVPEAESMTRKKIRIRITPWLARKKGVPTVLEGIKAAETEEALLLDEVEHGETWIPKSQIEGEVEP